MLKETTVSLKEQLFEKYRYLVYAIVNRIDYGYLEREDLIQAGLMGLFDGICHLKKDDNIICFLKIYITSYINKELRCNKLIVVSKKVISIIRKLKEFDYTRYSLKDLSSKINCSKEDILLALEHINKIEYDESIIDEVEESNMMINLDRLTRFERDIIFKRYYLNYSQTKLKEYLNCSQSKVSKLERKIIEKLKSMNR